MFLALGVGAWPAAIFHFMTHAFFKALLFLGAGIVIESLDGEHDIFRMGGLRQKLPVPFWTFLIAGCSLAGLPLITAGAFSKGWIVWGAYSAANGSAGLWAVALAGVFLTALYTFRMIFLVFFGQQNSQVTRKPGQAMMIPCVILAFLSIAGGYIRTPFASYLSAVLPWNSGITRRASFGEMFSEGIVALVFFLGLCLAYVFFLRRRDYSSALASSPASSVLHRFWFSDWGMDWLYHRLFVRPVVWMAKVGKGDPIDGFYTGVGRLNEIVWRGLSLSQSGRLRWYAAVIAAGAIVLIGVVIFS